jgi:lysophospholipase L1-like esterase
MLLWALLSGLPALPGQGPAAREFVISNRSGAAGQTTFRSANISTVEQAYVDGMAAGMTFKTETIDPRLVFIHQPLQAGEWKSLWIRFSRTPALEKEQLEFYFITKTDRRYGAGRGIRVPIPVRTGITEVVIDLASVPGWSGEVVETRLDFGQRPGVTCLLEEVKYSTSAAPGQPAASMDDPIMRRVEQGRANPVWNGGKEEAIVLNSEYIVPMGAEKPILLPVEREDRAGIPDGRIAFTTWWSACGSTSAVDGGWESALWWLRDMETITFRYKVKQVQGEPELLVRLYERTAGVGLNNNDAWLWRAPVKKISRKGGWQEVTLSKKSMEFRPFGEGIPEWECINYMTVLLTGRGHDGAELIVESPRLHLRDKRTLELWDPARRYAQFDTAPAPAMTAAGEGRFLVGKGGSLLANGSGRALLLEMKRLIPNLGLAANQGMGYLAEHSAWLCEHDIGVVYQQGGAYGLAELISEEGAWATHPSGRSRNNTPGAYGMVGVMKYYDMTSPGLRAGFADVFKLTARAGVPEFQIIESYWPSQGGFWNGGAGGIDRLRASLKGIDEGLEWRTPEEKSRLHFWDFFARANGFAMKPEDIGIPAWDGFEVPRLQGVRAAKTDAERRHYFLMMNLVRYEALKFYGATGNAATAAGVKLGTIINRENYDNAFDMLGLMAQPGIKAVGHEYFGNPAHALEGAFEHGQILQALSKASGTEVRGVVETNATGTGGRPYYDPQIAYAVSLALWSADRPGSVESDFLSWNAKDIAAGGSAVQRERHADFILKGLAWQHVMEDGWQTALPQDSLAVIRNRKLNDVGTVPGSFSLLLQEEAWPRVRFDFGEAMFMGKKFAPEKIIFGEWSHLADADIKWLEDWLRERGDRVVVMSGFRPGKRPDGTNYVAAEFPAYVTMNSQEGFRRLLGGRVTRIAGFAGRPKSEWLPAAELPERVELPAYYYLNPEEAGDVRALVSLRGQPLVSERILSNGARIIYLHYDPDASTRGLDRAILHELAARAGARREVEAADGLLVRRFAGARGVMIAAFDTAWMQAFRFTYDPRAGLRMKWNWKGPPRRVILHADEPGAFIVDLLSGKIGARGTGETVLALDGAGCGLWVLAPDQETASALAARARGLQPFLHSFAEPARAAAPQGKMSQDRKIINPVEAKQEAGAPGKSKLAEALRAGKKQTVVIYGTSLSQGGNWGPSWFQPVQDVLEREFPGQLAVINSARGGQNSRWGAGMLDASVIAKRPDCVFIEFSINDAVVRFDMSLEESRKNMVEMIDRIHAALPDCEIVLQITNPVVGKPEGNASHRGNQEAYEQIYRELARERGLILIDNAPRWRAILDAKGEKSYRQFVPDGVHPINSAYKMVTVPNILGTLGFSP